MPVSTLSKIVLSLTILLVVLSTLLFLQQKRYIPALPVLYNNLKQQLVSDEIESLQKLYQTATNKPVTLSLSLDSRSIERVKEGLKHHLNTVLEIGKVDGKIVKYILQTAENGERHFTLDAKTHRLKGAFKTFKHTTDDGTVIVKLVPLNPAWIKGS